MRSLQPRPVLLHLTGCYMCNMPDQPKARICATSRLAWLMRSSNLNVRADGDETSRCQYDSKERQGRESRADPWFIEEAGDRDVDILVLPEACLQGYIDCAYPLGSREQIAQRRYFLQEAEGLHGSCLGLIGQACQRAGLYAQVGFIESNVSNAL